MDEQNKNLILATALSFAVILVWFLLFPPPEADPALEPGTETSQTIEGTSVPASTADTAAAPGTEDGEGAARLWRLPPAWPLRPTRSAAPSRSWGVGSTT